MLQDVTYQQIKDARHAALTTLLASSAFKDSYCGVVKGTIPGLLHVEFLNTNDERLFEARMFGSMDFGNLPPSTLIVPSPRIPDMRQRIGEGMSIEHYLEWAFERQKSSIVGLLFQQLDDGWQEEP